MLRSAFGFDHLLTGRIARILGGLGQFLHAGLGIVEGDDRFARLEGRQLY